MENLYIMSCFSCQLGHMRKKFLLCPAFLVSWDICEKSSYYVPYKCHNRTFVASSRPYVPLDFYRRTFYYLLSICPIQISQQDISGTFSSIYPICLTQRDIFALFLYMSYFVLLADFLHRGAITTNIDKLNRRQKSSAACYITYAVTLIKLLFPKMLNVLK